MPYLWDADGNANAAKSDPYSYCDVLADSHCDCYCDADVHAYSYANIHDHAECYGNSHSYSYSKADVHCAAQRDTEVTSYAATAPIAVRTHVTLL